MKTFEVGTSPDPIEFQVGEDVFYAVPPGNLPANILIRYSEQVQDGKVYEAHKQLFARVLIGESADRFIHRMDSLDNPINLATMVNVAEYLIGEYAAFDPKVKPKTAARK